MSVGKRLGRLESRLAHLERENAEMRAVIAEQRTRIAELEAENARLRGETGKSSRNSSKPPSSDTPAQRAARTKKPGTGNNPGGQPGHEGHQRALIPPEKVNRTRDHFPVRCRGCRGKLASVSHGDPLRHQVVEV